MDATITLTKQNVTQQQVNTVVTLARNAGWTVEWTIREVVA